MKLKGKRFTPAMIVAMIALAVALSGTAAAGTAKLIYSSSQIKDGAIGFLDINEKARAQLKGQTGAPGAKGDKGDKGETGSQGPVGPQGETVRWERVNGTCVTTGDLTKGEVMVNDGVLKLGLASIKGPYAQFKMLVENTTLADVSKLSFRLKLEGSSNSYMKLQLENNQFIVFQPGAQTTVPGAEWVEYNVADEGSKLRDNNDSGTTPTFSLAALQALHGNLIVKSLEITAGCAGGANNGAVLVDDVTLNDTVIDFS